jgi:bacterioferritin
MEKTNAEGQELDSMDLAMYRADFPYPAIKVQTKNPNYARIMLSNVGDQNSEASSVALYLYDQIITAGQPEISQTFAAVKQTEAKHLELFCDMAYQLGADPRLWAVSGNAAQPMRYWSPAQLSYTPNPRALLQNALALERATIAKYEHQTQEVKDDAILLLLRRILVDESMHVELFRHLLAELERTSPPPALPAPVAQGLPAIALRRD